jgi:hypothetical protein
MGWQSYVIYFNSAAQLKEVLDVCMAHNAAAEEDDGCDDVPGETPGEELYGFMWVPMKNNKSAFKYMLMCGHGGGRSLTFEYFDAHLGPAVAWEPFEQRHEKLFDPAAAKKIENICTYDPMTFLSAS